MALKIVFFGTPEFARTSLEALLGSGHRVLAVVTAPDKPAGRGQQVQESEVKRFAEGKGLTVIQPVNLKDKAFQDRLRSLGADLFVVVAFRMLPEAVWKMPRMGSINLHASLLPAYRGAAPINRAIMNGENKTGLSTFLLSQQIDTGDILLQEETEIGDDETAGELHDRMMAQGAALLCKTLNEMEKGSLKPLPQSGLGPSSIPLAPKIFRDDCRINWNLDTGKVHNLIRGLSPYPAAWTLLKTSDMKEKVLKIYRTRKSVTGEKAEPGILYVVEGKKLFVSTSGGCLEILELQAEGKKRMKADEFLRGMNLEGAKLI